MNSRTRPQRAGGPARFALLPPALVALCVALSGLAWSLSAEAGSKPEVGSKPEAASKPEAGSKPEAAASPSREYQVKAAFLYNFVKFINWPPDSVPSSSAAMSIGVLGDSPMGAALSAAVQGKSVKGRELVVRQSRSLKDLALCQVLFIGQSEGPRLPEILPALQGAAVLTVGETEQFGRVGGIIRFLVRDNKVRFEINVDAAERARLNISSKLLSLATVIHDPLRRAK